MVESGGRSLVWLPLFLIWRVDDGKGRQTNSKQIKSSVKSANTGAKMGAYRVAEVGGHGRGEQVRGRGLAWATHASVQKSQQIKRLAKQKTTVKPPQLNGHEHKHQNPLHHTPLPLTYPSRPTSPERNGGNACQR